MSGGKATARELGRSGEGRGTGAGEREEDGAAALVYEAGRDGREEVEGDGWALDAWWAPHNIDHLGSAL